MAVGHTDVGELPELGEHGDSGAVIIGFENGAVGTGGLGAQAEGIAAGGDPGGVVYGSSAGGGTGAGDLGAAEEAVGDIAVARIGRNEGIGGAAGDHGDFGTFGEEPFIGKAGAGAMLQVCVFGDPGRETLIPGEIFLFNIAGDAVGKGDAGPGAVNGFVDIQRPVCPIGVDGLGIVAREIEDALFIGKPVPPGSGRGCAGDDQDQGKGKGNQTFHHEISLQCFVRCNHYNRERWTNDYAFHTEALQLIEEKALTLAR